jgi:general secretion pathway protein D
MGYLLQAHRILPIPIGIALSLVGFGGCSVLPAPGASSGHLAAAPTPVLAQNIPATVPASANLARPKPASKVETYTVSVRNVPVDDLLFALARDAKVNIDLHPGITGVVTINAIDQTLQQILTRMSKQIDMRWELDGPNLSVMPDAPFLRTYRVDYVNMSRDVSGSVAINTQVASTGVGSSGGNSSTTDVKSIATNHFWKTLEANLVGILNEKDRTKWEQKCEEEAKAASTANVASEGTRQSTITTPANGPSTTASGPGQNNAQQNTNRSAGLSQQCGQYIEKTEIIANPDAGVVVARATSRQHEKIREYLDLVLMSAKRQVMIEATIAEVQLTDSYEQGINWQSLRMIGKGSGTEGALTAIQNPSGLAAIQNPFGTTVNPAGPDYSLAAIGGTAFLLNYVSPGAGISGTLKLLETFGNVKVLSSPKISVLNNQTATLRVGDNVVYFEVKSETQPATNGIPQPTKFTTTAKTVSVGLVLSVTPQISDTSNILLNVRPTITRTKGAGKADPHPDLKIANIVPEIETREMESMLRLTDGEIAVMGGLMSDEINNTTDAVPGVSKIPWIGNLFTSRKDISTKKELVIFLKPTIIREPSINGDYRNFRDHLPNKEFFDKNPGPKPVQLNIGSERVQ